MSMRQKSVYCHEGTGYVLIENAAGFDNSSYMGTLNDSMPLPLLHYPLGKNHVVLAFPQFERGVACFHISIPGADDYFFEINDVDLRRAAGPFPAFKSHVNGIIRTIEYNKLSQDFSVSITQILDFHDDLVFRFIVTAGRAHPDEFSFAICDLQAHPIDRSPIALSEWQPMPEGKRFIRLYSICLPKDSHTVCLQCLSGTDTLLCFDVLDETRYRRMIEERDSQMVNPGIDGSYHRWSILHRTTGFELMRQRKTIFKQAMLFSIITPLYNTPAGFLKDLIDSVVSQTYRTWELILVDASPDNEEMNRILSQYDDNRIRVIVQQENLGIAGNTNSGINASVGEYIVFVDHDDALAPDALFRYAEAVNEHPMVDLLYCDEDSFTDNVKKAFGPLFKPEFNLDLLYSHNYIVHMLAVSRYVLDRVELSPDELSGAQDYDLTLKAYEHAREIVHIPYVLYHWRVHAGSTNGGSIVSKPYAERAGALALDNHYARRGFSTKTEPTSISCVYRTCYDMKVSPSIGVVIVFSGDERTSHISSITMLMGFISNGMSVLAVVDRVSIAQELHRCKIPVMECKDGYSQMFNKGAESLNTDILVLMDSFVESFSVESIRETAQYFVREEVGVVAPKGFARDHLVLYTGACLLGDKNLGLMNQGFTEDMGGGYLGMAECTSDYSACAGPCIATRSADFNSIGGFSTAVYGYLAFADYCFRLRNDDKLVMLTPYARYVYGNPKAIDGNLVVLTENEKAIVSTEDGDFNLNPNLSQTRSYFHMA